MLFDCKSYSKKVHHYKAHTLCYLLMSLTISLHSKVHIFSLSTSLNQTGWFVYLQHLGVNVCSYARECGIFSTNKVYACSFLFPKVGLHCLEGINHK